MTNGQVSSGVTAASAIAALQEASGRSSRAATRSAYRAYARMIRMVIERIRQFYDLPRKFRILGAGGAEEYVSYCNAHLKAQSLGADGLLRTPVFDVTVTTQKHTEYTKLAQNELALQFFQLGFFRPGMEQQALACLDMMDFDGKEQVLQKIRGGTQDALWQRMALTLAQRYEPELFASLTDSAQGMRADVRLEGEKAPCAGPAGEKTRRRGGAAGMITVQLSGTALTVRGHAGFSRYGSDIVCAAASMLAFTLAAAMEEARDCSGHRRSNRRAAAFGSRCARGKVSGRGWRWCSPPSARVPAACGAVSGICAGHGRGQS